MQEISKGLETGKFLLKQWDLSAIIRHANRLVGFQCVHWKTLMSSISQKAALPVPLN